MAWNCGLLLGLVDIFLDLKEDSFAAVQGQGSTEAAMIMRSLGFRRSRPRR